MNNEITIIVPINAKAECREKVREKLLNLTALTNEEAGNVCYCLHETDADPNQFVIYEKWQDQAALDFHMEQDYLKNFLAESDELLSEPIQGKICKQIA